MQNGKNWGLSRLWNVRSGCQGSSKGKTTFPQCAGWHDTCDSRYLANIENEGTLPSLPVVIQLIKICGLPVERYFNPELMREESAERQRVSHKLQLCPEEYLPIVEGAIDGALRIHEQEKEPVCVWLSCTVIERMQKRPLIFLHFAGKTGVLWCHSSGER